jgi:outer membrane protein assembly factor BamB
MESPWPVAGSVLVDSGVAYFAAGRHPASDGGVFVWALQVRDARVLWQRTVTDTGMKSWYGPTLPRPNNKIKVGVDYEPVDMFVKDGDCVAMSRWRFKPDNGEFTLDVANLQYEPFPGLSVPRGLWSYGIRQTKMVQTRPPAVFSQQKLYAGTPKDAALLLAGDTLITATADGKLKAGEQECSLSAPAIHDGLIAAYGRFYVTTADGAVACLGKSGGTR